MRFRGQLLDEAAARSAQRAIQIIFQDPFGALDPRMPVSAIIAEPLLIQRIGNRAERAARAADLVEQVGPAARRPEPLSARILRRPAPAHRDRPRARPGPGADRRGRAAVGAGRLDPEPDPQSAGRHCSAQRGLAYLFISHDLAVVNHLADRVAVLYLGRLVEVAPRAETVRDPVAPLHRRPCWRRCRASAAATGEPSPSTAKCRARSTRRPAACSTRVARRRGISAAWSRRCWNPPPARPAQLAACHFKA